MGLLDRFKTAEDDAPEGDDVEVDPLVEDEDVLEDDQVQAPDLDYHVQDTEATE